MNLVILVGRLTKDPELAKTDNDNAICKFDLAVPKEVDRSKPDFIKITTWRNQAENCYKYLRKGSMVSLRGRISNNTYQNNDGKTIYRLEVVADKVNFLSSAKTDEELQTEPKEPQNTNKPKNTFIQECVEQELPF